MMDSTSREPLDPQQAPHSEDIGWVDIPRVPQPDEDGSQVAQLEGQLKERWERLIEEDEKLRQASVAHDEWEPSAESEASLDNTRREIAGGFVEIASLAREFEHESDKLSQWRGELGDEQREIRQLRQEAASVAVALSEEAGHPVSPKEHQEVHRKVIERQEEIDLRDAELGMRIGQYNRQYATFVDSVHIKIETIEQLLRQLQQWLEQRREHNQLVESWNYELAILQTDSNRLLHDRSQLIEDTDHYLGPIHLSSEIAAALGHQLTQRLWQVKDRHEAGAMFEILCADLFKVMGLDVEHIGGSDDNGVDILAKQRTQTDGIYRTVIQCKLEGSKDGVAPNEIAKFAGRLAQHKPYNQAIVVTAGRFHEEAIQIAHDNTIELWHRDWLLTKLLEFRVGFEVTSSLAGRRARITQRYWNDIKTRISAV